MAKCQLCRHVTQFTNLWLGELNPSVVLGLMIGNVVNPGSLAQLRRILRVLLHAAFCRLHSSCCILVFCPQFFGVCRGKGGNLTEGAQTFEDGAPKSPS